LEGLASWAHYTTVLKKKSAGVAAVTVDECVTEGVLARPDPEPFREHAVVDFTGVPERGWRSKSKKLQAKARARGWLHQAATEA
jgi:hypothetical protein